MRAIVLVYYRVFVFSCLRTIVLTGFRDYDSGTDGTDGT